MRKGFLVSLTAAGLLTLAGCSSWTVMTTTGREYHSSVEPTLKAGYYNTKDGNRRTKIKASAVESITKS